MDLIQRTVSGTIKRADGSVWAGAQLAFSPVNSANDDTLDFIVPNATVNVQTDSAGVFTLDLYTVTGSFQNYYVRLPQGELIEFTLQGDAATAVDLADLLAIAASAQEIVIRHASTTVIGGIRVDGVTIEIDGDGIISVVGSGGVTDHGDLTGLADDDHGQYLTQGRGDARYYTEAESDVLLALKQPIDADLTTIAALAPADDAVLQRKAGAWTGRTPAQLKTDLNLLPPDMTLFGLPQLSDIEIVPVFMNLAAGDNDFYTVPADKKAMAGQVHVRNNAGGTLSRFLKAKIAGVYHRISNGGTLAVNTSTITGSPHVFNAGEIFAITYGSINMAAQSGIWLFPDTHPLKTLRINSLDLTQQVLYTVPAGKKAFILNSTSPATFAGSPFIQAINDAGVNHTLTFWHVPSGGIIENATKIHTTAAIANAGGALVPVPIALFEGDQIVVQSSDATAGCSVWLTVFEIAV